MGVREMNLIGQDTTCYGEDLGLKDGLAQLLARLGQIHTSQPKWIRFLYAYPNKVTQRLLDTIAEHESLVKYIDMPLQHASAQVLKGMKRGASGDIFLKLIERIRRTIPGVAIRTSMIVGFPGETEKDFEELCAFVKAARFDRLGVFSYSDEDTSKSYALAGKVDARTIYNRKRKLMSLQRKISQTRNRQLVGCEFPVLMEGPSPETEMLWQARLATQAPEIDGVCLVNDFGPAELNTAQIEDLASRGYVVVSIDHTHEALVVEFPGGRVARQVPGFASEDPKVQRVVYKRAIDARVADTRFVLDRLAALERGRRPDGSQRRWPAGLRGALDLSRVGMFG